ncbi:MAG: HNH endonuclease [Treponema sp.]|nr:HNH endonuclease [Treponema sp.]
MIKTLCGYPGCDTLSDSRYCPKHHRDKTAPKPFYKNAVRYNSHLYNTVRWRKLRNTVLKTFPCCQNCGAGRFEAALELHHITPPKGDEELFFSEDNLMPLCKLCHAQITSREPRNRRRSSNR